MFIHRDIFLFITIYRKQNTERVEQIEKNTSLLFSKVMFSDSINSGLRIKDFKIFCLLFMDHHTKTLVHCSYRPVEIINIPPESGFKYF